MSRLRYSKYTDDIENMVRKVRLTGMGDYMSPNIYAVRYNTYDEKTTPTITSGMIKSILCGVNIGIFEKPILTIDNYGCIKFLLGFINVPDKIYVKNTDQTVNPFFKLISVDSWKLNRMKVNEYPDMEIFRRLLEDINVYAKDRGGYFRYETQAYLSGMFLIYPWFEQIYKKLLGHYKTLIETFTSEDLTVLEEYVKLPNRLAELIDEKDMMETAGFADNNNLGVFVCKNLTDIFGDYVYEGLFRYTYRIGDTKILRESKTGSSDPLVIGIPNDNLPAMYSENSIGKLIDDVNRTCYMYKYYSEDNSLLTKMKMINNNIKWIEYYWEADRKKVITKKAKPKEERKGLFSKMLGLFKKREVIKEEVPVVETPKSKKPLLKYYGCCYYSLTMDRIMHDVECTDKIFISFTTFDKYDNDRLYVGINLKYNTAKTNRFPYSTKGYYPSYEFGMLKQDRLTLDKNEMYTTKQKEEIDIGMLQVMESLDLEELRRSLENIIIVTDKDFWEIKVKEHDVVLISDKYDGQRLIYVFGDKHVVDYETRGEKAKYPIKDEDVEIFKDYRYRIPKVFEVDTTEDDYIQEIYMD